MSSTLIRSSRDSSTRTTSGRPCSGVGGYSGLGLIVIWRLISLRAFGAQADGTFWITQLLSSLGPSEVWSVSGMSALPFKHKTLRVILQLKY